MPNSTNVLNIGSVRQEVLKTVLRIFLVFGSILAIWSIGWDLQRGSFGLAIIHSLVFAFLAIVALAPSLTHLARTALAVAVLLIIAFSEYLIFGPYGEGPIFVVSALALVTLMVGKRAGYIFVGLTVAGLVLCAIVRIEVQPNIGINGGKASESYEHWVATFLEILVFCSALNYMVGTLIERINHELLTKQESEARYRLLADNAEDVIWTVDRELCCTFVSPSVTQMRGWRPEELIGHQFHPGYSPEMVSGIGQAAERLFTGQSLDESLEADMARSDGSTFPTETVLTAISANNGDITGLLGVTRDVTARYRIERERKSLEDQLRQSQKMDSLGQLAGGIAHDLNNLLQVISGYSELAQAKVGESSPAFANIAQTKEAADRATSLVRQLLAFSRQQVLETEAIDLNSVVQELAQMLERLIGEDLDLNLDLEAELRPVDVDQHQIEQVIMNLCVNARDAMAQPPNDQQGELKILTGFVDIDPSNGRLLNLNPGPYVVLSVTDTGSGIEPEIVGRLFDPFFTTKLAGEGTGLGLSTAFGIVRQHDGTITVDTELGVGTTFTVYLPATDSALSDRIEPDQPVVRGGTETILLADDEEMVLHVAADMLQEAGYSVLLANNGTEALEIFVANPHQIDLVLLDVVMPRLGGKAASQVIRKTRPDLPILFCSGYSSEPALPELPEPRTRMISKPYLREELLSTVRQLLDLNPKLGNVSAEPAANA